MSLMVVVASCLYTALYTGFRAYRSAQAAVDPTSVAINVIELLKQDICGVLPPGSHLAGAFIGTDSGGIKGVDADSLEFYTTHVYVDDTQLDGLTTHEYAAGRGDRQGQSAPGGRQRDQGWHVSAPAPGDDEPAGAPGEPRWRSRSCAAASPP